MECLRVSYHISSLVSSRSNMSTFRCCERIEKQAVTGCLLASEECMLPTCSTMQCRWKMTATSEIWTLYGKHTKSLAVVLLYCRFRASLSITYGRSLRSSSQRVRSPDTNFWNNCMVVHSLTALSPKRLHVFRNLMRLRTTRMSCFDTAMFHRRCSSYDWFVCTTHLHWSRAMSPSTPHHFPGT